MHNYDNFSSATINVLLTEMLEKAIEHCSGNIMVESKHLAQDFLHNVLCQKLIEQFGFKHWRKTDIVDFLKLELEKLSSSNTYTKHFRVQEEDYNWDTVLQRNRKVFRDSLYDAQKLTSGEKEELGRDYKDGFDKFLASELSLKMSVDAAFLVRKSCKWAIIELESL